MDADAIPDGLLVAAAEGRFDPLANAEPIITQPGWTQRTGFTTAGLWYLAALNAPVLEQRFLAAWSGLDLLVQRHLGASTSPADPEALASAVLQWRDARGYDYISDDLVDRWVILRDDFGAQRPEDRVFTLETPTDGANLLKLFAAYSFGNGPTTSTITARLDNATNELYHNHLNYLKDLAPEVGRNFRLLYGVKF